MAGENGNTSTGANDAGAELFAEGKQEAQSHFIVPAATSITEYIQNTENSYVPEKNREVWFTNWFDDYSDQDDEYGKGNSATWETARNTGRYMSSKVLDRMIYSPVSNDREYNALILDCSTEQKLSKTISGNPSTNNEKYLFAIILGNLPEISAAGSKYPVSVTDGVVGDGLGMLENGQKYLVFDEKGTAKVSMEKDDVLTVYCLMPGAIFHITETDRGSANDTVAEFEAVLNSEYDENTVTVSGLTNREWKGETKYTTAQIVFENIYHLPEESFTVIYTDGVDGEEIFKDQSAGDLQKGEKTPAFIGTTERDGYKFIGWSPVVPDTVTGNAIYVAQWEKMYTVIYTDGVHGETIFKDQVYTDLEYGVVTPEFQGRPYRRGYKFIGWEPVVTDTVTKDMVYVAQWKKSV